MSARTLSLAKDASAGRKLGKYEVVSRLGSGGMAEIFLAFHRGPGGFKKLVVLKKVLPDVKAEEEAVQMFLDEAKITAAFTHPNIAHVYDLDIAEGELFLAMEFIPGADLVEIAKACADAQEAIPTGFSLTSVRDCAHALHYAHTFTDPMGRPRPTIHRDVAEKNIMVTYDGITKLLDFGIAKAQGRVTQTAAGMVKGTSGYMSPEQVRGEQIDARSDVFALGVVLHEMLTGTRLFYGNDPTSELLAVLDMEAWPPSERNPEVTPEIDQVVLKALAKDRKGRFSSALEFARSLEKVSRDLMWDPEQCGALVVRHFSERREQTQKLLAEANADEKTGNVRPPLEALQPKRTPKKQADNGKVVRSSPLVSPPAAVRGSGPKSALKKPRAEGASGPKFSPEVTEEKTVTGLLEDPRDEDITRGEPGPAAPGYEPEEPVDKTVLRPHQPQRPHPAPQRKAKPRAAPDPEPDADPPTEDPFSDDGNTLPPQRLRNDPNARRPQPRARAKPQPKKAGGMGWLVVLLVAIIILALGAIVAGLLLRGGQVGGGSALPTRPEF